jgi:hypothetical protein
MFLPARFLINLRPTAWTSRIETAKLPPFSDGTRLPHGSAALPLAKILWSILVIEIIGYLWLLMERGADQEDEQK